MQFWILTPSVHVLDIRELGFRHVALVTANDSSAGVVAAGGDGSASPTFTTFFRVNGARVYARGGNMVPMDELEARVSVRRFPCL